LDTAPNRIEPRIPVEFECVERLEEGLASRLSRIKGKEVNWQRRFDLGHRCYLALHNGEPVGFGWVCPAGWLIGNEQPVGALARDVAFSYDGITCEPWRGNRIASARLAYIFHEMQRQGFERSCLLIADENRASQRSTALVGYRRTESVVRIHRWMMILRTIEGGPPAEVLL
jgi:GNAT superfamily N-acetyltransferase